jgi:hypothetical protein
VSCCGGVVIVIVDTVITTTKIVAADEIDVTSFSKHGRCRWRRRRSLVHY